MTDPENNPLTSTPQRTPRSEESRDWTLSLVLLAMTLFLVVTRLIHLDARPFHHDESLFSYYGWLESNGTYDSENHHPLLHGPLQMQILGLTFKLGHALGLLGDAFAAARLPAAVCGIALVLPLLGLRRRLGKEGVLIAVALMTVSPAFWFYSRFCRNEMLMVFTTLVLTWTVLRAWRSPRPGGWIVISCLLATTLGCLKENALFLYFDALTFLVLTAVFGLATSRRRHPKNRVWLGTGCVTVPRVVLRSLQNNPYAWITGLALSVVLLQVVYTNGFDPAWPKSFIGKYAENLEYWKEQNREHRLYGEFHYYLRIIFLYEAFSALFLLVAFARFASSRRRLASVVLGTIAAALLGISMGINVDTIWRVAARFVPIAAPARDGAFLKLLHMTHPLHLGLAMTIGWLSVVGAWEALRGRQVFRAWLIWWTGLSFLQYSYAGEKVPWLVIHILLPMLLLTADLLSSWWRRSSDAFGRQQALAVVFTVFAFLNIVQGYRVCFVNPTNPGEILVFNHTQPAMKKVGMEMRRVCKQAGDKTVILLQGQALWPLVWYIHGYGYIASPDDLGWENVQMIACDLDFADKYPEIESRFELTRTPLRRAWLAETLHLFARRAPDAISTEPSRTDRFGASGAQSNARSTVSRYGLRAWETFFDYIVFRHPWNARRNAQPEEVYIGRPRRPGSVLPTGIEYPTGLPSDLPEEEDE